MRRQPPQGPQALIWWVLALDQRPEATRHNILLVVVHVRPKIFVHHGTRVVRRIHIEAAPASSKRSTSFNLELSLFHDCCKSVCLMKMGAIFLKHTLIRAATAKH